MAVIDKKLAVSHSSVVRFGDFDLQCFAHVHCRADTKPTCVATDYNSIAFASGAIVSIFDNSISRLHILDLSDDYVAELCLKSPNSHWLVVASYKKHDHKRGELNRVKCKGPCRTERVGEEFQAPVVGMFWV